MLWLYPSVLLEDLLSKTRDCYSNCVQLLQAP